MELQILTVPVGPGYTAWSNPTGSQLIVKASGPEIYWKPADQLLAPEYEGAVYFKLENFEVVTQQPLIVSFSQSFWGISGILLILPENTGVWLFIGDKLAVSGQSGMFTLMGKVFTYEKVPSPLTINVFTIITNHS